MVLSTMLDTVIRYVFSKSLPGVIEYNGILLAVLAFMGLAGTQLAKGHIQVTSFVARLNPRSQLRLEVVHLIVALVFVAVLGYETLLGALHSFKIKEYYWGVIGQTIYIWWAKFSLPVGLAMLFLQFLADLFNTIAKLRGYLPEVGEDRQKGS